MASVDEIVGQLERQLAEASAKIDDFVLTQSRELQKAGAEHDAKMRQMESKITKLQHEDASAAHRLTEVHATLEAERRALGERKSELLTLKAQSNSLPVEVDAARAAETEARAQLDRHRADFERRESEVRFQLQELTKGVAFYKRLGLEFEKIHDERLRLVFTLIDPLDPARPFAFNVRVSEADDAYSVDGVDPPVPGVPELVAQLNRDNDFSRFVQLMRRRFIEGAAAARATLVR